MRKHLPLTFQHRAGVRPNTSSYEFAESCVFTKQSPPSVVCHHTNKCMVSHLPKLQEHFAEFLQHGSLTRLGILYLSTSVGLGYGKYILNFSRINL